MESLGIYLHTGYLCPPRTLFKGLYRVVVRTGDHDALVTKIVKPFPDGLEAQRPERPFALHLSGGFDSSIIALAFDREDVDYMHLRGSDTEKARAVAAKLRGRLHEVECGSDDYIEAADDLVGRMAEPYCYPDVVFAYVASRAAKALGHDLVVAGDGGDGVFGGARVRPNALEATVVWKTIDPNAVLGLRTLQPLCHSVIVGWSASFLRAKDRTREKAFAARRLREAGMPPVVTDQKKQPWSGKGGVRDDPRVAQHWAATVTDSDYAFIRDFRFATPPDVSLAFRQFSLVRWLEANYAPKLSPVERNALAAEVQAFEFEKPPAQKRGGMLGALTRWAPPGVVSAARRVIRPKTV